MNLKRVETIIIKLTIIQFVFMIIAQIILSNKSIAPYLSRTIYSEGVFFERIVKVVQILDQVLWL